MHKNGGKHDLSQAFQPKGQNIRTISMSSSPRGDPDPERHTDMAFNLWLRINRVIILVFGKWNGCFWACFGDFVLIY